MTITMPRRHRTARSEANTTTAASPVRELVWSLAASTGLVLWILVAGFISGSRPCASTVACWGLVVAGILGTHLASRNVPWGWLLLVSLQPLWVAYAFATEQQGFAVSSLAYGLGQLKGFLRSRRGV